MKSSNVSESGSPALVGGASRVHRSFAALVLVLLAMSLTAGCTLIRYRDPPSNDDNGDGGPPKVVDMLVLIDVDRSAANLTPYYHQTLQTLIMGLALKNVAVRSAALAPLYHRSGEVVPLLYGEGDPRSEFEDFGAAIQFYTYDDGQLFLQSRTDNDGENLATLGLELGQRAIYRPRTADPEARPYFLEAADGFVVVYMTASPRPCAANDEACELDGMSPASYFTRRTDGVADWLSLGDDTRLPPSKIFHLAVVTAEATGYGDFAERCRGYSGFPATMLDVMEPSPKAYYTQFVDGLMRNGGRGLVVDLCQAMSARGEGTLAGAAAAIRATL